LFSLFDCLKLSLGFLKQENRGTPGHTEGRWQQHEIYRNGRTRRTFVGLLALCLHLISTVVCDSSANKIQQYQSTVSKMSRVQHGDDIKIIILDVTKTWGRLHRVNRRADKIRHDLQACLSSSSRNL